MHRLLIIVSMLLVSSPQLKADTITKLQVCQSITSNSERLRCFDKLELGKASSINAEQGKLKRAFHKQEFGKETWSKSSDKVDEIIATVEKVQKSSYGKQIITLSNQQTWKQLATSHFKLRVGDRVSIERGSLNSFFLSKSNSSKKEKFTRIN
ncbi:hypothetical protein EDC56_1924 [Sinobacterium caligoides]|uniref:Uncharacterized protein n=1 Tax=Sinobacterium caligoides TaxID=933926 RepID=A0A3N2DP54_9GAMM|nr:hypothetical protein [Sinobacterium caligoides]ROS01482.1 hypothetical protein EDC56_1924 [Sinobacterium caligoides]